MNSFSSYMTSGTVKYFRRERPKWSKDVSWYTSKAVKWKHIRVMRNGHLATCVPEATTLYIQGLQAKVETRK